jgi:hypothetical protein
MSIDPHPDTVEAFQWMVTGVLLFLLLLIAGLSLFMAVTGIEQIDLLVRITP